ncbi:MAG: DNA polymerase IV [bacterium]
MRRILHVDMDAFFAMIEQKRRPALKGLPVVVGGRGNPASRGVVSTASYEARKFGIRSAMPLRTAYALCPRAVFLPVDYETYSRVSRRIKGILREISPVIEDVGIDEAFLDISQLEAPPEEIAGRIKARILQETGLTCSIGIAPNKLLAKMGSDLRKPDGLTILVREDVERLIWPLAVRKLHGVGPKTEAHLKAAGIRTIGDLASLSRERLINSFGRSYGTYLYAASRGMDDSPVVTEWEPRSMSRETTFDADVSDRETVTGVLRDLAQDVVSSLKRGGYRGRTVGVKIRFGDFKTITRAMTFLDPSDSLEMILEAALRCLDRVDLSSRSRVRLVGIRVTHLERADQESLCLF